MSRNHSSNHSSNHRIIPCEEQQKAEGDDLQHEPERRALNIPVVQIDGERARDRVGLCEASEIERECVTYVKLNVNARPAKLNVNV
jgi:hypothetical protein